MISDFPGLSSLSAGDKILLAAELFKEASAEAGEIEIDPQVLTAIEDRLHHYEQNPSTGLSWDEVKKSLRTDD